MPNVWYGTDGDGNLTGDTYCHACKESSDVPGPVGTESDTPQHCIECERLLRINLTDAGREYVARHILEAVEGRGGRPGIILGWAREYPEAGKLAARELIQDGRVGEVMEKVLYFRDVAES